MNEEIEGQVGQEEPQVEHSPIEQKALEMGWRPKEEFEGEEEEFIDAKEFVHRQPLFDKISHQNKQIKNLQRSFEALQGHYTKVNEAAYKKALSELEAKQTLAVEEGDLTTYHALNQRKQEIENDKEEFVQEQKSVQVDEAPVHPELQAWISKNDWYDAHPHMRVFADDVGTRFRGAVLAKTMTPAQVLKEIEKAVRLEFPTKFRNPNKDKASAVEGTGSKGTRRESSVDLSDQEKQIMNTLVRGGHITKEKYLADLKAIKKES